MVLSKRRPFSQNAYMDAFTSDVKVFPSGDGELPEFYNNSLPTQSSKRNILAGAKTFSKGLVLIVACYFIFSLHSELVSRESELALLHRDFEYIEETLRATENEVNRLHEASFLIQSQLKSLHLNEKEIITDRSDTEEIMEKLVQRQNAMVDRIKYLQQTIGTWHRDEAIEKFGSQPFLLQFNVRIENNEASFIVELAPLEMMPHSVHLFMEMVASKLWENTIFLHDWQHVLFTKTRDANGLDKSDLLKDMKYSKLTYPEYNEDYPHKKYTLGFAGRPGGPEFYINTDDNTYRHGPGGQKQHALREEADSCFGKVIKGHEVVDRMQGLSEAAFRAREEGRNHIGYTILESIKIVN